jgi:hypothetical protein
MLDLPDYVVVRHHRAFFGIDWQRNPFDGIRRAGAFDCVFRRALATLRCHRRSRRHEGITPALLAEVRTRGQTSREETHAQ